MGFSNEAAESVFVYQEGEGDCWEIGLQGCPGDEATELVAALKEAGLLTQPVIVREELS